MSFIAELFPEFISFHARGGSSFSTNIVVFGSGNEARNRNWLRHRGKWDVAHAARESRIWKPLQAFFNNMGGMANSFLYKDWFDFEAAGGEGVLIEIDGTHNQLARRFTTGSQVYDHPIYKPKSGTVVLSGGGTVDYTTGIVTGGTPTAWTGEFYKPARFDTDAMEGEILDKSGNEFIVAWESIPIIEVRLEEDTGS